MPSVEVAGMSDGATFEVINPSNGQVVGRWATGTPADVEAKVVAARQAHADGRWRGLAPSARKAVLERFADLVEADAAALDALDAEDMGKPVSLLLFNALGAASLLRYYAQAAGVLTGDVLVSEANSYVTQRWTARGVIGAIVPWNFPTYIALLKAAPALAGGNCVVLKPSEMAPRSALRLTELGLAAGLPPSVFDTIVGLGSTVGQALALHMNIDMLTFTGSTAVGKLMLQYAGRSNMKTVVAECGGKSPQIVFGDGVDLDAAADAIAELILANQGQVCSTGSRVLVERTVERSLVERLEARLMNVVIGDARDPATTFGPIASAPQLARVMNFIGSATTAGARLVTGGQRVREESGGYFVEPTMYSGVDPSSWLAQEEVFGPVLSVIPFDTEEEALRLANGTIYGLAAYVWTADLARGMRMGGINSSVWINAARPTGEGAGHATSLEPFGQSGIGVEGGIAGLQTYLRRQTLSFQFG